MLYMFSTLNANFSAWKMHSIVQNDNLLCLVIMLV